MHIFLGSKGQWVIAEEFCPINFFNSLTEVLFPTDVLAVGSYEPLQPAKEWLQANSSPASENPKPYQESFHLNIDEYPEGRSWEIAPSRENLSKLSELCFYYASNNMTLFCDDIVAFRKCGFIVPLFDYHHAFRGGELVLSGFFEEEVIARFGKCLGVNYRWRQDES